ncbi:MAG: hypothetical protein L0229_17515 [Blastocatellia bacterium]|nr:hypothetical protein [Blastocatellia bacterium]
MTSDEKKKEVEIFIRFERRVARRMRALALQDILALALLIGGILSAAAVLYIRLRPLQTSVWAAAAIVMGVATALALVRWFAKRATERDAAFEIDRALALEDRAATAQSVIERGGPHRAVETALLDDAAERVARARPSSVAPYRLSYRHILGLLGVIAVLVAVMIPERSLPGGAAVAEAREDIQTAGEQLEQTAEEIEKIAPPDTETAGLAREQAELGRALRRSVGTRAEALKKLSALEERIRKRHDELASTRADEIVSLAENRFESALSEKPKAAPDKQSANKIEDLDAQPGEMEGVTPATDAARNPDEKDIQAQTKPGPADSKRVNSDASKKGDESKPTGEHDAAEAKRVGERGDDKSTPNRAAENRTDDKAGATETGGDKNPNVGEQGAKAGGQSDTEGRAGETGDKTETQPAGGDDPAGDKSGEEQKAEGDRKTPGGTTGFMAEQAAKSLSGELLKKAEQLRAGQLSAEDIKRIAEAADSLAKDLTPLAESKEFQQSLEQLARQVDPEQLERVARELLSREDVRKELEAAARLLMQNRQAKEIASGMAEKFGRRADEMRAQVRERLPKTGEGGLRGNNSRPGKGVGRDGRRNQLEKANGENPLSGRGKETSLGGQLQRHKGGEYLYLEARPGSGAARTPYSSVYPQYRREAERSVERSQIPLRYRSVIRDYFDSINPDAKKKN